MENNFKSNKGYRLLNIYERLNMGEKVNKSDLADEFGVTQKTIQRDLDDLRMYFYDNHQFEADAEIRYDRSANTYSLIRQQRNCLTNTEVLAACKILLESRALCKSELFRIIDKILLQASDNDRPIIKSLLMSEYNGFVELKHKKKLLSPIWLLSECIESCHIISFYYVRQDGKTSKKTVKPVAIMFSEFYFYLIAFSADETQAYPVIYRIDRMTDIKKENKKFFIPYRDHFSDSEFRKRVQFMYSGELKTVTFEYTGVLEAILDRLPTAKIISREGDKYTISAESYGDGILMWLHAQGEKTRVISVV